MRNSAFFEEAGMSDNQNHNAGDGCEFTHEELELALPYLEHASFSGAPVCPFCSNGNSDLDVWGSAMGRLPRAVFVRCPHCHQVYFRPDAQEPALMNFSIHRSLQSYLWGAVILPLGIFLGGCLLFGSVSIVAVCFTGGIALFLALWMGIFIRDYCATEEEIRASQKRLESNVYLAALRDRGVRLPYYYLRQLEKGGESAESSH